tara:strand:- start:276 stop:680 length:405 start_codon:yes stop_codon:yes gene_type:complete
MRFEVLDEDNFLLYAIKNYTNPSCTSMDEFNEDMNTIKYIKRLFNRYLNDGDLRTNLIVNHLILMYNVFGNEAGTRILFYRVDKEHYPLLKTFLVYLNRLPDRIYGINDTPYIDTVDIPLVSDVFQPLRDIDKN